MKNVQKASRCWKEKIKRNIKRGKRWKNNGRKNEDGELIWKKKERITLKRRDDVKS